MAIAIVGCGADPGRLPPGLLQGEAYSHLGLPIDGGEPGSCRKQMAGGPARTA